MTKSLDVQQLSVSFQTEAEQTITALDQVSFYLHPSETVVLLGESGCGKSLTSLSIMRLLPAASGYSSQSKIYLTEQDLLELPEQVMQSMRGKRVAMIFQEPMTALNPVLSIGQQLAEAILQHQKLSHKALKQRLLTLLEEVEIPEPDLRLHQYPHQLSGGQKQRVVIAMALANHPEVLIADEPTTALDVTIQGQILSLLKKLQQQYQMSLLLITHDLSVVKAIADRVYVMYAGQIVEVASVADFFQQPLHPYVQKMMVALPSKERRGEPLQIIKGQVPPLGDFPNGCHFHPRCAHAFEPCSKIEPQLQSLGRRFVRCHLYPDCSAPPPLPLKQPSITPDLEMVANPFTPSRGLTAGSNDAHQSVKDKSRGNVIYEMDKQLPLETSLDEVFLSVRHLKVYFSKRRGLLRTANNFYKAVDDLSFNLSKSKTLALVGESGCGKTTVAKVLLRLQTPTAGHVYYRQKDLQTLHGKELREFRRNVQIIFQDPFSSLNPRLTIAEILAEGMQSLPSRKIQPRQYELLDQVNLPRNSLQRYPHQFSGGQRQRICIARALATNPQVLICDEPTSALDISVQAQILNLLKTLQQTFALSYLFITHNMDVVAYMADEVLVMREGRLVELGSYQEIFEHPQQPYTRQLLTKTLYQPESINR